MESIACGSFVKFKIVPMERHGVRTTVFVLMICSMNMKLNDVNMDPMRPKLGVCFRFNLTYALCFFDLFCFV